MTENSWWRRKPSPAAQAIEHATVRLKEENKRRKSALAKLMQALEDFRPDEGLEAIAKDIRRDPR